MHDIDMYTHSLCTMQHPPNPQHDRALFAKYFTQKKIETHLPVLCKQTLAAIEAVRVCVRARIFFVLWSAAVGRSTVWPPPTVGSCRHHNESPHQRLGADGRHHNK